MLLKSQVFQRALLVGDGTILMEGVQSLIKAESSLKVLLVRYKDEMGVVQNILRLQPDILVLQEMPALDMTRFLSLLRDILLKKSLRVVVVSLDRNTLEVYENQSGLNIYGKQNVTLKYIQDFISLVRNEAYKSSRTTQIQV